MRGGKTSSPKMATIAAKVLNKPSSSNVAKKLAGSVLSQAVKSKKGK